MQEALIQEKARLEAALATELQQEAQKPAKPPEAVSEAVEQPEASGAATADPLDAFMTDLGSKIETDKVRAHKHLCPPGVQGADGMSPTGCACLCVHTGQACCMHSRCSLEDKLYPRLASLQIEAVRKEVAETEAALPQASRLLKLANLKITCMTLTGPSCRLRR